MNNSKLQLKATSSLAEWLSYLENSHFKAIDLGLERIKSVAEQLDLLQIAPFVITVGGTNGKGTTCRLLETLLLRCGYRVGVYSSPHLLRYNERVRIQNQELSDEQHCQSFAFIEQHKACSLTYFEFSTLSALHLFKQAKLDVVILEVGLGGRLDATNIIDNQMSIITSIDIDHTDFLGSSREQIAFEKAGIFRTRTPVIIGEPNVPSTMIEQAEKLETFASYRDKTWHFEVEEQSWAWQGEIQGKKVRWENLPIPRIPLANAATVLAAIPYLPFKISQQQICQALQEVELTGRFQRILPEKLVKLAQLSQKTTDKLPQIIVDVGHNPHAALYLTEKLTALKAQIKGRIIAVCGILKDKDAAGILSPLLPVIDHWYCATLSGYRGQEGGELLAKLQQLVDSQNIDSERKKVLAESQPSVIEAVKSAVENANENDLLLVFGSFHTVGEFLALSE